MVFGEDLTENVKRLAGRVDHIEIVLFYTPFLHNIPGVQEIRTLKKIGDQEQITFSVHLPDSLEIASRDRNTREASVRMARNIFLRMWELAPQHYILHIPFSPPTLVPTPGVYFTQAQGAEWDAWTQRGLESLELLCREENPKILVENINYSPHLLEPFWKSGFCELCLDLGHLVLGQEKVMDLLKKYLDVTSEIHLHGVEGYTDHLSLSVLPVNLVSQWIRYLQRRSFKGVLNLEVFSLSDLETSMDMVLGAWTPCPGC